MASIVISYRRDDSKWIAGRIYDRLEGHYGKGHVFMDIDSIPIGLDFRDHIRETLDRCDVLVAIVGPNWIGNREDSEHILDETDWVRIEIESALNKKIPVIPVLIDRSRMPKPGELPETLQNFAFRQAAKVDTEHFHSHMDRVIASIDQHLSKLGRPDVVKQEQVHLKAPLSQRTVKPSQENVLQQRSAQASDADKQTATDAPNSVLWPSVFGVVFATRGTWILHFKLRRAYCRGRWC
jgi:hypothetical protein